MSNPAESELAHLHVWELLPWIVNGRASDAERKLVDAHMRDCNDARPSSHRNARCARRWRRARTPAPTSNAVSIICGSVLTKRRSRPFAPARCSSAPWRGRMTAIACGLAAVVLLETGALATLGFSRGADSAPANYHTLSEANAGAARATIRLVADPAMPVGRLQALLVPLHLQIVGGPSENGVYSLGPLVPVAPGDVARQLGVLRAAPGVRFAEPVGEGASGP